MEALLEIPLLLLLYYLLQMIHNQFQHYYVLRFPNLTTCVTSCIYTILHISKISFPQPT